MSLDWKWLFIYPEQGIAAVNELAAPVDTPINFKITSSDIMNSFFIPALAGQIYSMAGMETKLHGVINKPGVYKGFSANYSGAGFSGMRFEFHGVTRDDFRKWVATVRAKGGTLDRQSYARLAKPSANVPVRYYASVAPDLYDAILNMCVDRSKMCMDEMMMVDAGGGGGIAGVLNVFTVPRDERFPGARGSLPPRRYVGSLCTPLRPGVDGSETMASVGG